MCETLRMSSTETAGPAAACDAASHSPCARVLAATIFVSVAKLL